MRNLLIVTGQHFAEWPRKVDLHFIAQALNAQGDHVDFLSIRLSPVSRFVSDGRWEYAKRRRLNQWVSLGELKDEFIWFSPVHPFNLNNGPANAVSGLFCGYFGKLLPKAVKARFAGYTHVLVESGLAVLLTPEIRAASPGAIIIYHAADRLSTIKAHPCVEKVLRKTIGDYDLVHIVSEAMRVDFPVGPPILYLPHGVEKEIFDGASVNPFLAPRNAVSVGDSLFDGYTIKVLAQAYPDWTFHLFGERARLAGSARNVVAHGELPFERIANFIKYADIGLAPFLAHRDADYLGQSSLKMIQYTYCRLPIVAPRFAAAGRGHVQGYEPGDKASIIAAFDAAMKTSRTSIDSSEVTSWEEQAAALFEHVDALRGQA